MPTVLRRNGFEVRIYTHDHEPAHVHVFRAGDSVIIELEALRLRSILGMSDRDTRRAFELVSEHRDFLLSEWVRIGPIP